MLLKKNSSKSDAQKLEEILLERVDQIEMSCRSMELAEKIRNILDLTEISNYFLNLEETLFSSNLTCCNKYCSLTDGVYILLQGQLNFVFQKTCFPNQMTSRNKDVVDFEQKKLTKNSIFCKNMLMNWTSSSVFLVFQCIDRNVSAIEGSTLIKISEDQAIKCEFYGIKNTKRFLLDNHFLSTDHRKILAQTPLRNLFAVDDTVQSNFSYKKYVYRDVVMIENVGILAEGSMKLKWNNANLSKEFEKCGVILPDLEYEVVSSEAIIMIIRSHENCISFHPKLTESLIAYAEKSRHQESSSNQSENNLRHHRENLKSLDFSKKSSFQRHKRDAIKAAKDSQYYSIISTYLCEESLSFANRQNQKNNLKEKKINRCQHPLVLFQPNHSKSKILLPSFPHSPKLQNRAKSSVNSQHKKQSHETISNKHDSLHILKKLRIPVEDFNRLVWKHDKLTTDANLNRKKDKTMTSYTAFNKENGIFQTSYDKFEKYPKK